MDPGLQEYTADSTARIHTIIIIIKIIIIIIISIINTALFILYNNAKNFELTVKIYIIEYEDVIIAVVIAI